MNTIGIQKLTKEQASELLDKPLYELSESEVLSLAFLTDIEVLKYWKSDSMVQFKIVHGGHTARVEHDKGMKLLSLKKPGKMGMCFGGQYSFAHLIQMFRMFICRSFELTLKSNAEPYTGEERLALSEVIINKCF